jgi:hypothetical protein
MRVTVITPTTGKKSLEKAMKSVADQTVLTGHYIVMDGPEAINESISNQVEFPSNPLLRTISLPENVGANNWYGHRDMLVCR